MAPLHGHSAHTCCVLRKLNLRGHRFARPVDGWSPRTRAWSVQMRARFARQRRHRKMSRYGRTCRQAPPDSRGIADAETQRRVNDQASVAFNMGYNSDPSYWDGIFSGGRLAKTCRASQAKPSPPNKRAKSSRPQSQRTFACRTDRAQIHEGPEQRSVISPEVSVQLISSIAQKTFRQPRYWLRCRLPARYQPLFCPTAQGVFRFIAIGGFTHLTQLHSDSGRIAPWPSHSAPQVSSYVPRP